jgi:hypothetical protein
MNYTQEQINDIVAKAKQTASKVANEYFNTVLNGKDNFPCGFAWVEVFGTNDNEKSKIKGNSKLGAMLKKAGFYQDSYDKVFKIWNPSGHHAQNIYTKEAGAYAAANVLEKYGFRAYFGSRLD